MRVIIALFAILLFQSSIIGQSNRPTLNDLDLERLFIEAKQSLLLDEHEKGIKTLNSLLKRDSKNDAAYFELAKAYKQLEEFSLSEKNASKAYSLDDSNSNYLDFLVELYLDNSDFSNATKLLEKKIANSPSETDNYHNLAYSYLKQNKAEKAIDVYNKLEKVTGPDPQVIERKFTIYKILEKEKEAIKEAKRLIKTEPNYPDFYHLLGEYYLELEKFEEADAIYDQILAIDPKDQRAQLSKAEKAFREGDRVSYLKAMNILFKNPEMGIDLKIKESVQFLEDLGKQNNEEGFEESMFDIAKTIREAHPSDAKAYSLSGEIYYYASKPNKALEQYKKTIELDESKLAVWENLMFIQSDLGQTKELLKSSESALEIFPNHPLIYYLRGVALSENQEPKKATKALEEALLRSSDNLGLKMNILVQLGNGYNDIKEYKKSDKAFDEALSLNPNNALLLNNYSYFLSVRNEELEKAEQMAIKANQLSPDNIMFQDTYGWVLYQKKEYKKALEWLDKAVENGGKEFGEVLEHLGDVHYRLEDTNNALKYWKLAAEKDDASDKIKEKIAKQKIID